jgi:hypothetical protein
VAHANLIISGIIDGPFCWAAIKFVACSNIGDLSPVYGVKSANNGGKMSGPETVLPKIASAPGSNFYLALEQQVNSGNIWIAGGTIPTLPMVLLLIFLLMTGCSLEEIPSMVKL